MALCAWIFHSYITLYKFFELAKVPPWKLAIHSSFYHLPRYTDQKHILLNFAPCYPTLITSFCCKMSQRENMSTLKFISSAVSKSRIKFMERVSNVPMSNGLQKVHSKQSKYEVSQKWPKSQSWMIILGFLGTAHLCLSWQSVANTFLSSFGPTPAISALELNFLSQCKRAGSSV